MLFHGFPNGRIGVGLLLLRAALGFVAVAQGAMNLAANPDASADAWIAESLAVVAGISMLIGILTPFAATLIGILTIRMWSSITQMNLQTQIAPKPILVFIVAVAATVAIVGPGAFSVDARLFGLREIIIPPRRPPDRSRRSTER